MDSITQLAVLLLLSITSQQVLAVQQQHHTISVQKLLSGATCSSAPATPASRSEPGASTLQLVRRACLRAGGHNQRAVSDDHYTTILRRDHYRVWSIHRRLSSGPQSATTVPARLGLPFHTHEYVVTVGIGTPPRNLTVLFDTGSDLTWVQCAPCTASCYQQEEPLFDPSKSSTYADIPCSAQECQIRGGQVTSCRGTSCTYNVKYGDQSENTGNLAHETVTLSPLAPPASGVVFGCSEESSGFGDTTVAGLLGLGRGDSSIVSQTRESYGGGVFSYCLPPHGSSAGYLTFGAAPDRSNLAFTPLRTDDPRQSSFYVVDLAGISVGGAALPIPAGAFSAGTIIDSGTVVTRVPFAAYYPLRDEVRRQMASYTMLPEGSVKGLDTCYDVTGHDVVTVPRVALEFAGGVRMDVDPSGVLFVVEASGTTLACLAFLPMDAGMRISAIVGNMQQRAYTVVFDVAGGRLGLGANGCS